MSSTTSSTAWATWKRDVQAPPRHHTPRSDRPTLGEAIARIGARKGRPHMPWQLAADDLIAEVDPATGRLWYDTVAVTVQRQAGKTAWVGDVADHRGLSMRGGRIWFTQQNGKSAGEWMREEHLARLEASPFFRGRYKPSLRGGSEGLRWLGTGSTFYCFPPKRDALHSKQADLGIIDEAWAHSEDVGRDIRQALRPAMLTRPNAQLLVISAGGTDASAYLQDYIDLGVESLDIPGTRVAIIDYGIPDDVPDDQVTLELNAAYHPAYGHTFGMDALVAARNDFKDDWAGFLRAYGNRHTRSAVSAFPPGMWDAGYQPATPWPAIPRRAGIGFDVTPIGDRIGICAAWRDEAGHPLVEVIADEPLTREAPGRLVALARRYSSRLGYDTAAPPTLEVADELARLHHGRLLAPLGTLPYATSCSTVYAAVMRRELRHNRQPALDGAVEVATRRPIADGGFGWGRKSSTGHIHTLVAATVALRTFDDTPRAAATAPAAARRPA